MGKINEEEELMKNIIRETVDDICLKKNDSYNNICRISSRSVSDRDKIINNVFDLMTSEKIQMGLKDALSSVDANLEPGWGA